MLPLLALAAFQADLRQSVADHMRELRVPGAAVAVWKGGRVVFRRGFGSTTNGGSQPVDGSTVFEAASLTKPVFAASVHRLVERKVLDLDAPLVSYLNGPYTHLQQPWNPNGKTDVVSDPRLARITARMVLSHRTGLPNVSFNRPLAFIGEPNGKWGYSGEGYLLLQRAVELRTGKSAAQVVQDEVLTPLRMDRSALGPTRDLSELAKNATRGHNSAGESVGGTTLGLTLGSLLTCLDDYVRFMEWSRRFRPFHRPEVVADERNGVEWGLGWGLVRDGKDRCLFQWGWNDGYRNFALLNVRTGDGVLLLTNSDDGMELVPSLVQRAMGKPLPVLKFPMLGLKRAG